ncbi:2Fe-2S ferredoxin-type domain-containing protein [Lipomyces kononenkoae]|uniref:2Fe-2S ferredoxin-type domain-containing protein n=1 Tax=Lipomyces kononenkoae TaxID=34357 RepID=A0ACC3T6C7_LIPKO
MAGLQVIKRLTVGPISPAMAARYLSSYSRKYLPGIQSPSSSVLPSIISTCCIPTSGSCRLFSRTAVKHHGHVQEPKPGEEIHVTFITREGDQVHIDAAEGDNLLDIAQAHDLDMEGACGGSCACSTCHVIVDPEFYDLIPEPEDDENDMLDLAFGLTETSRLGCQVKLTKELDGLRVALPQMTRNLQAKDFEKR